MENETHEEALRHKCSMSSEADERAGIGWKAALANFKALYHHSNGVAEENDE
jgi:hypothetical protein